MNEQDNYTWRVICLTCDRLIVAPTVRLDMLIDAKHVHKQTHPDHLVRIEPVPKSM